MMSGFEITSAIRSSCQTDSVRLRGGGGGALPPAHTHNAVLCKFYFQKAYFFAEEPFSLGVLRSEPLFFHPGAL